MRAAGTPQALQRCAAGTRPTADTVSIALQAKPAPGRPPKLSGPEKDRLENAV